MNHERPGRKVRVDFEELRFAMEDATDEHSYFLDTESGELILVSELFEEEERERQLATIDAAEPGRFLTVPRADSREGYADMRDFIDTVGDAHVRELLDVAIQGRGAFRRFKDVLARHPDEQKRWFAFQAARQDARTREWLADEGFSGEPLRPREP